MGSIAATACGGQSSNALIDDAGISAEAAAAQYLSITSAYQGEVLSDGLVTAAEYEAAGLAVVECIESSGFITADLVPGPGDLKQGVSASWQGSDDQATDDQLRADADRIQQDCIDQYWRHVDHVYHKQAKPSENERQALLLNLVACFKNLGIDDLDVGDPQHRFAEVAAEYDTSHDSTDGSRCVSEAEMAFFES